MNGLGVHRFCWLLLRSSFRHCCHCCCLVSYVHRHEVKMGNQCCCRFVPELCPLWLDLFLPNLRRPIGSQPKGHRYNIRFSSAAWAVGVANTTNLVFPSKLIGSGMTCYTRLQTYFAASLFLRCSAKQKLLFDVASQFVNDLMTTLSQQQPFRFTTSMLWEQEMGARTSLRSARSHPRPVSCHYLGQK